MNQSLTISEFLQHTGAISHYFDMGRRVMELEPELVLAFERTEIPYPQPFLRSAWLGILFQHGQGKDRQAGDHIWFLKLPLDEQGLLQQAARDDVLRRITETLTRDYGGPQPSPSALDDNPYGFTPRQDRMAVFHAKVSRLQGHGPSQYFYHAVDYFRGKTGFDQWQFVGLQGIADVATRRDEVHHDQPLEETLAYAIPLLPEAPYIALCGCLENEDISPGLSRNLALRIHKDIQQDKPAAVAAGIRGLSYGRDRQILYKTIHFVLDSTLGDHVEILAAIAGRAWEALDEPALRQRFLENLARCEAGQQAFDSIITDLLFMPGLRKQILENFRQTQRSDKLSRAIGSFMQLVHTAS